MGRVGQRRIRAGVGAAAAAVTCALALGVSTAEVRAHERSTPTSVRPGPSQPETSATAATPGASVSEPVVVTGKSPAGRAGTDPAGGISGEVVAWLMAFGVLVVVWCLAWRWRPQETRMVVRQGNGRRDQPASADDPRAVRIKL
jgi:hypothetical protein